jgi:hypothetical protein
MRGSRANAFRMEASSSTMATYPYRCMIAALPHSAKADTTGLMSAPQLI